MADKEDKGSKEEDEEMTSDEHEEDIYDEEEVEKELEDGEISSSEAGFMEGYDRDVEKKSKEKKED
tara:strand:- start:963 stop:1160 length:198 start_codon:yes stop_codon:yes gene_type:complete